MCHISLIIMLCKAADMAGIRFQITAMSLVRFVGFSCLRRCVNNVVIKAVFYWMAEEKKKFYRRGLFRIKIEIVYIYIASKRRLVGV